jgi:hypothetical protein
MSYIERIKILAEHGDPWLYPKSKDTKLYLTMTRFRLHEAVNTFFKYSVYANELAYRKQRYYKPTGVVVQNVQHLLPLEYTDYHYLFRFYQKSIAETNSFTSNWFSFENMFYIRYVNNMDPVKGFTDLYEDVFYKSWCTRDIFFPTFGELSATGPIECFNDFYAIVGKTERLTAKAPFKVPWFLNPVLQQWFHNQYFSIPFEPLFLDDKNLGYKNYQLYYMFNYAMILAIKFSRICDHMECTRTNLKPSDNPDMFFRCPLYPNNTVFNINQLF